MKIDSKTLTLIVIILAGAMLRFYNLNWGAPFYFHPDERNIASAVSQLSFPTNLNPHFFAYGSFPIYGIYLAGIFSNFIAAPLSPHNFKVGFEEAIIISRIFSAAFALSSVFLIYKISYILTSRAGAFLSLVLSSASVGLLQFSHLGTFEIWISFFSLILFLFFHAYFKTKKEKYFMLGSIILGLLISIKISNVVLFLVPLYSLILEGFIKIDLLSRVKKIIRLFVVNLFFSSAAFIIFSPFILIDYASFIGTIKYETNVATGLLPVFYTGGFLNTLPIIFQYIKVLPFLINPLLAAISIPATVYVFLKAVRTKDIFLGLCLVFFFSLFLPSSFLFAKWTRYILPSIPFFYIIISIFIVDLLKNRNQKLKLGALSIVIIISIFYSFAYVKTVRLTPDTRLAAVNFAKKNIPSNSIILSEVYDLGIVPFNDYFPNITLFNFYELGSGENKQRELETLLKSTDYIILPSQRILRSRIVNREDFPNGYTFYSSLLSGELGFKKLYETPCDFFCKIIYLGNPVFNVEETINVFDRPTVFIFKRR